MADMASSISTSRTAHAIIRRIDALERQATEIARRCVHPRDVLEAARCTGLARGSPCLAARSHTGGTRARGPRGEDGHCRLRAAVYGGQARRLRFAPSTTHGRAEAAALDEVSTRSVLGKIPTCPTEMTVGRNHGRDGHAHLDVRPSTRRCQADRRLESPRGCHPAAVREPNATGRSSRKPLSTWQKTRAFLSAATPIEPVPRDPGREDDRHSLRPAGRRGPAPRLTCALPRPQGAFPPSPEELRGDARPTP